MGIRKYKPTTPGRRFSSVSDFSELTRSTPEKSLLRPLTKTGGRNSYGRVTARRRGGGHKRQYRVIDFRRHDKDGIPAKVAHIEYDPNRTANIALLHFADGAKRYILHPAGVKQGDQIEQGPSADIKPGNCLPLRNIPLGTVVHAVELKPGGGAKIARSAGSSVQLVAKEGADQHQLGQGRSSALEGTPPEGSRCRYEPDRSPARWWRRPHFRWPSPSVALGQARRPHPPSEQAQRQAHCASSPDRQEALIRS